MSIFDLTTEQTLWVPQWRADGRFVLFGEGERQRMFRDGNTWTANPNIDPPAAMIEAAKPCETCRDGCDIYDCCVGTFGGNVTNWDYLCDRHQDHQGFHDCQGCCPDCSNGQRRHPITVPCPVVVDGNHPEEHDGAECWHCGDSNRISTGLLAIIEWGPDPVVKYGEHTTVGSYVVVLVEPDSRKAFRVENHRLPVEQHGLTLPPDVDPASLVGQWAIGGRIEVAG